MRTAAAVTALVLWMAVSGCSSDEAEPSTLPAVPTASAGTTGAEPSPLPSSGALTPRPSTSARPSAAATDAPAAAVAFARHFFDVINDAYLERSPDRVRTLSTPECGSCTAVVNDIGRLAAEDHQVAGRRYIVESAEAAPPLADGRVVVDFRFTTDPYVEVDRQKRVVKDFAAEPARDGQMMLEPQSGMWRVLAIRLLG